MHLVFLTFPLVPVRMRKWLKILKNFTVLLVEARQKCQLVLPVKSGFRMKLGLIRRTPWCGNGGWGTRLRQTKKDQRYTSCHIFGAVCPQQDEGAAIVASHADAAVMKILLEEISRHV